MPYYKIFNDSLLKGKLKDIETPLTFNTYLVSIVWPKNEYCLLSTLQFRFESDTPWEVAASNISSHTGEITVPLGKFNPDGKLQLFWIINAISRISAMAIYLINAETKQMMKVKPDTGVKVIEKGKEWMDEKLDIDLF